VRYSKIRWKGIDKMSKRGRLALHFLNGAWSTHRLKPGEVDSSDRLEEVFRDGEVLKTQTVAQIRERAATQEPVILAS
jgi:hypothetical protein